MTALARTAVTPVWLLLVLATLVSYVLGADYGPGNHTAATVTVMAVAFIKVRFVGLYFMELRHAPPALRLAFEAWVALFVVLVIAIYVLS
jgi:heme/copper-type cytochrome/quinol oxidase subunit 4